MRVAVLASGRGTDFEALCTGDLGPGRVVLLMSDREEAPALARARDLGVEALYLDPGPRRTVLSPEAEGAWTDALLSRSIDLVCLAGFMRMVRGRLLSTFEGRMLNIHPSLLPSFPGLHAQRQALERGVKISGCTVHYVDADMDAGPIVMQSAVPVVEGDTEETLSERILEREHEIYPAAVKLHCEGRLRIRSGVVAVLGAGPV